MIVSFNDSFLRKKVIQLTDTDELEFLWKIQNHRVARLFFLLNEITYKYLQLPLRKSIYLYELLVALVFLG